MKDCKAGEPAEVAWKELPEMARVRLRDQGSRRRLAVAVIRYELSAYRLWSKASRVGSEAFLELEWQLSQILQGTFTVQG